MPALADGVLADAPGLDGIAGAEGELADGVPLDCDRLELLDELEDDELLLDELDDELLADGLDEEVEGVGNEGIGV